MKEIVYISLRPITGMSPYRYEMGSFLYGQVRKTAQTNKEEEEEEEEE